MADVDLARLESTIKQLPGVLGCVVLPNPDGSPAEIQAFTSADAAGDEVERSIIAEAEGFGVSDSVGQVFVLALEADAHLGDREALERAAEMAEQEARSKGPLGVLHALGTLHSLAESTPDDISVSPSTARTPFRRVILASSTWTAEAQVTLGRAGSDVVGRATGAKTPYGLQVIAEATLQAVHQLGGACEFRLRGASLVSCFGREAVVVLVEEERTGETLGSALVNDAPVGEAAVRATLDAVNRRIALSH
jgi:hypothetical protein